MKIYKIVLFNVLLLLSFSLSAKEYKASLFGVVSDGVTLNTGSIQYAIDYINENGGGTLQFYVGRYLTGSLELKSNVTIELNEGAVMVAVPSIYDYIGVNDTNALITADGQENIGITGKGVIEGQGLALQNSIKTQVKKGYLKGIIAQNSPLLIYCSGCSNVNVSGIIMQNACGDIQSYVNCKNVTLSGLTISNKAVAGSKGVVLDTCDGIQLADLFFDTTGIELYQKGSSKNVAVVKCINTKGKQVK